MVLDFIRTYTASNGVPPSLREIAAGCHLAAFSAASYHVDILAEEGALTICPGRARWHVLP